MTNLNISFKNIIDNIDINNKPNLFLHVCCCPCSSHIILKLIKYFNIYIIFYNPNIDTKNEFDKRLNELKKFIMLIRNEYNLLDDIEIIYEDYDHNEYLDFVKGCENEPEGGKRCELCYNLRLHKSFDIANEYLKNSINELANNNVTNYFCTSLTTSPYKNAMKIYDIGNQFSNYYLKYLPSDFKKNDGYLDSIKLCKKYDIYRQNYCGCEFAKNDI